MKKLVAVIISLVLIIGIFPFTAFSADADDNAGCSSSSLTQVDSKASVTDQGMDSQSSATALKASLQNADMPAQAVAHSGIIWWIILAAAICITTVFFIFRKKILERLPKALCIIMLTVLGAALILSAFSLIVPQAAETFFGSSGTKTVSFETNGGSDIPSAQVPSGGKLTVIPTPIKADNSFTGWYTDAQLSNQFYPDATISSNMTLYASYVPTQTNFEEYEDPQKYAEDCAPDYTFSIVSSVTLTAENLSDYVQATAYFGELPELSISGNGNVYTVSPAAPYPAGGHFRFDLLDSTLGFEGESDAVRTLDFRIHKDDVAIVKPKDNIIYVLWSQVKDLGEDAYYVPASLGIKTDDTVCFWDGNINDDTRFFKITLATPKKVDGHAMTLVATAESQLADLLDEVDVCFEQDVDMMKYLQGDELDKLALSAKNSEGTRELTNLLACAIANSPSFQALMTKSHITDEGLANSSSAQPAADGVLLDDGTFKNVTENNDGIALDLANALVEGLTVTTKVCSAQNPNFPVTGENDWTAITLSFTYETVIKDMVEINAVFTVKEYIKSTMQGYKEWDGADLKFDYAMNNYSQTQVDLSLLIRSKDNSDSDYLDITKEIEKLTSPDNKDEGDVTGILDDVLGAKGDDIELVEANLFHAAIDVIPAFPVFQVNFDLDFVVKVNFAAGISANTTIMASRQLGMSGSTLHGIQSYSNVLSGNNRYSFDMYCAGYLGFKAGLRLGISLSFKGLPDLGQVGISGEVGGYLDLYGFMHLNLSKPNTYQSSKLSLHGGLYMELGIYIEVNIFARSDWFKVKAEYTLYEQKFPLFSLGDKHVFLKFVNNGNSVIINKENYPLDGAAGLFDAEYIDITTGEVVTGDYTDLSNFVVKFSTIYFDYSDYAINVRKDLFGTTYAYFPYVAPETKRLDATATIYYTGSSLAFSYQQGGYTAKNIDLTWIDSSIDLSTYPDMKAAKATYFVDIDGDVQQVAEKVVRFGDIPGSINLREYMRYGEITDMTNDFQQPIVQDTDYTVHIKQYQVLMSYLTYHDKSWHFDVYAVTNGTAPNLPKDYGTPGQGVTFTGWRGTYCPFLYNTDAIPAAGSTVLYDVSQYGKGFTLYHDLDTTKPLYSVSGSYDKCYDAYFKDQYQNQSIAKNSKYFYEAQYQGSPVTIKFSYPEMSYTYCGKQIHKQAYTFEDKVEFNKSYGYAPLILSYAGCDMLGWDENADGAADYAFSDILPRSTYDMTLTAIIKHRTHTVNVLDVNGKKAKTLTVNEGDLPSLIKTTPDYPNEKDNYAFKYWAVSKSGSEFAEWNKASDSGIFEDWTIKPVYDKMYTVTFDYAGGIYNGVKSQTLKLKADAYKIADLSEIAYVSPAKAADVRNTYAFSGWSCGNSFTVTGDMTMTAQYTATTIPYTAEFVTDTGAFDNGESDITYTGDYDSMLSYTNSFMARHAIGTYKTNTIDKTCTLAGWHTRWQSETKVRYEAVWSSASREYTVTFDAGTGTLSNGNKTEAVTLSYGASGDFSAISASIVTPEIEGYTYKLTGWKDHTGKTYGISDAFTVNGNITFTAVYEKDQRILYTVTLNAAGGKFADDDTVKTYSGYYGAPTNISAADPTRAGNAIYNYVFDGWSSVLPTVFSSTKTFYAQWQQVYKDYTVTFNANGGAFADSSTTKTQTYHYNSTITPPAAPTKPEDASYTYAFNGWSPSLSAVTQDCTYNATWLATLKGGLEATGISVSDGTHTEDINCNGKDVSGYTYALQDYNDGGSISQKPVLTITGDGLTLSGNNSNVYVDIDKDCSSITLDDLVLHGAYPYGDGLLSITDGTTDSVTIHISGSCSLTNTTDTKGAVRSERPLVVVGEEAGSSLNIGSVGCNAIYLAMDMEVNELALDVYAASGNPAVSTYAIMGGDTDLHIIDADFTARGKGAIDVYGSVILEGNSDVSLISTDDNKAALLAFGEDSRGYLKLMDFTGEFRAYYQSTGVTGPAVQATSGISFTPDDSYNLNGAVIALRSVSFDSIDSFYTFVVNPGAVPQPSVRVTPKTEP